MRLDFSVSFARFFSNSILLFSVVSLSFLYQKDHKQNSNIYTPNNETHSPSIMEITVKIKDTSPKNITANKDKVISDVNIITGLNVFL